MSLQVSIQTLRDHIAKQIIGQERMVTRLLIALLADGHLLVEGAPGLAKTKAIRALATGIEGEFSRIQFTPDLLPSDLTGTDIYRPQEGKFDFQQGPLFNHVILADEINRAPAKVQSALLEAMAERQITVGKKTYPLPELYMVMATQNPIEQEGTYPLPEAQLDRFLMYVKISYPNAKEELNILKLTRTEAQEIEKPTVPAITQAQVFQARQETLNIHMTDPLEQYIVQLVMASREPKMYHDGLEKWIRFGASPRATIALDRCARAHAWLAGRDYVTPDDVQIIAHDVLRHRILVSFEAEAQGISSDRIIDKLIDMIPVP